MKCKNCRHLHIVTDDELCKRALCMATKSQKGRTITWHMAESFHMNNDGEYEESNVIAYFADQLDSRKTPKWCPRGCGGVK